MVFDDLVIVAIITVSGTVLSPLLLSWLNGRRRDKERKEDYARQDLVAKRAEKAADGAAAAATHAGEAAVNAGKAAETLQTSQAAIVEANRDQSGRLETIAEGQKAIHGLVNSSLTTSMNAELASTMRELALLRLASGMRPKVEPDVQTAIDVARARIAVLHKAIEDRNAEAEAMAPVAAAAGFGPDDAPTSVRIAEPKVRSHHRKAR
jgi:hypothetical protein